MYIADSESSSIRALDLRTGGSRLLAGGDPLFSDNLFKVIFIALNLWMDCCFRNQIISVFLLSLSPLTPLSSLLFSSPPSFLGACYELKLLQFGDQDGTGSEVLLQHPLGILCAKDGQVYIADSYNHKVLRMP